MNATRTINRYALPRPFLKWVGGKGQLLAELTARVERAAAQKSDSSDLVAMQRLEWVALFEWCAEHP